MIRRIIKIDVEKCNGCGLCADACHERAIGMVNGKATLLREDYCDGLGDCLPACPMNAISFEEREAPAYDEAAVLRNKERLSQAQSVNSCMCEMPCRLNNFPIQIKLLPINAPYFNGAELLIAADCTAFANANFHERFMKNKATMIACPKLDQENYAQKLTEIFMRNEIKRITVTRMTVPCCGGLPYAVETALSASGKDIPLRVVTIAPNGDIVSKVER